MTQLYADDGTVIPVTVIRVGNGVVTQVKTAEKDGYTAVQFAFAEGSKHVNKPMAGHVKEAIEKPLMREMRVDDAASFAVGNTYTAETFEEGETVAVSGTSKGRGFAGVVKRHGFHGAPKTHGHKHDLRSPGSIGATDAARVFPGMRMAGRMGGTRVTTKGVRIAKIDAEAGLVYIRGAVPGPRNGLVEIRAEGDMVPAGNNENKQNESDTTEKEAETK